MREIPLVLLIVDEDRNRAARTERGQPRLAAAAKLLEVVEDLIGARIVGNLDDPAVADRLRDTAAMDRTAGGEDDPTWG